MKKLMIVMIGMLSVVATLTSLRSMDSVPGNKNILNPELLNAELNNSDATITTIAPIPVKAGESYTMSMPASIGSDVSIRLSANSGSSVYVDERLDEAGGLCSNPSENFFECTFEPSHEDLDLEIQGGEGLLMHLHYLQYDKFQLEKNTLRTDYVAYEPLEDNPPELVGEGILHVSYTDGVPLSTILFENVEVQDEIDGVIPAEDLSVRSDAYTGHETTVGDYPVTIEATDSSGNTAAFDLTINVHDHKDPVIEGPEVLKVDVDDAPTANDIIETHFTFSDGHDGAITAYEITEDTHTGKRSETGEGSIGFTITDASGNTAMHTVTVDVEDCDAPLITGEDALTVYQSDMWTLEQIRAEYALSDNYDAPEDVTFAIDGGEYGPEASSGSYAMTLSASDTSGNTSEKHITVTVEDDIAPRLYGLSTKRISYTETFDVDAYIATMTPSDNDDTTLDASSVLHTGTDYVENEVGTYTHTFEVTDASGNTGRHTLTLNVVDDVAPEFNVVSSVLASTDNPLDEGAIQSMMMRDETLQAFTPVSYRVIEDGYQENSDKEGDYLYTVEYSNAEGETTLRSIEIQVASITEDEREGIPHGLVATAGGLTILGILVWFRRRR